VKGSLGVHLNENLAVSAELESGAGSNQKWSLGRNGALSFPPKRKSKKEKRKDKINEIFCGSF
jgi:hypothetical protein